MNSTKAVLYAIFAGLMTLMLSSQSFAATSVVSVKLWDAGPHSMDMLGKGAMRGMGMSGGMGTTGGTNMMGSKTGAASMGIDVAPRTIPAGEVTFEVTNASKDMVHEMVISPVRGENDPLPYDKSTMKVDEDAAGHLGEVSELEPGKSGALKLSLKPGKYILYCNIPGHYALGMWTLIKVEAKPAT